MESKRGQVTIFIIIGIVIVAAVVGYFIFRSKSSAVQLPADLQPVYTSFLSCIESNAQTGINVMESQGGYINMPPFDPGSKYMPFSSQLNFLGNPIPYWYYVSGNNIPKEQVPTQQGMENQLANYVDEKIKSCDFNSYFQQGFEISVGDPKASVSISDGKVDISVNSNFEISRGNESALVTNHKVEVSSRLGALYKSAVKVYDTEQNDMFLEKYGVDDLRLYAPVDGVDIQCGPETWNANSVFGDIQDAVEVNTMAMKSGNDGKYYSINLPVSQTVKFVNSKNWPSSYEVNPSDGNLLVAKPIGNQQGLGILGFCYVPYHFVYNIKYPILIQLYDGSEVFQFPFAVVIEGNLPRESANGSVAQEDVTSQLCQYTNTSIQVSVENNNLQPVDAQISYECAGSECSIGDTTNGVLQGKFPQCINGYVIAKADGYKDSRYLLSTMSSGNVNLIMDKLYNQQIQLNLDGVPYNGQALVTFSSDDNTQTISYPNTRIVSLGEGQYNVSVQIYTNSTLNLGQTTAQQCVDTLRPGVLGIIGLKHQECFDVNVPAQKISQVLSGGGIINYNFADSDLSQGKIMEINAPSFQTPTTLEELQYNYAAYEGSSLGVSFS